MPDYVVSTWYGIWGVKGTPKDILDRMHAEVVKAVSSPELREIWASQGSDTTTMTPDQFSKLLSSEIKRWAAGYEGVWRETGLTQMAGKVDASFDGSVATVTLDSPGKLNAVSVAMWQGLARMFNEIGDADSSARDRDSRAPVATLLRALISRNSIAYVTIRRAGGSITSKPSANALTAIDRCPVPLMAAIEGVCVGGGLEIASLCDIRLAADTARFGVPIGRLGFPLALPELVPLLRLAGPVGRRRNVLESRILSADEADVRRLITRVVRPLRSN